MAYFKPSYRNPNTNSKAYGLSLHFREHVLNILVASSFSLSCRFPFTLPLVYVSDSLLLAQIHTHIDTRTHTDAHTEVCPVFQLKQRLSWSHAKFQLKNVNQARQINTRLAPLDRAHKNTQGTAHIHVLKDTHTL